MSLTIKTKLGGEEDIRRFTMEHPSFVGLQGLLASVYPGKKLSMTYRDDENDEVTVTQEEEFQEAVRLASMQQPPVLRLTLREVSSGAAASSASLLPSANQLPAKAPSAPADTPAATQVVKMMPPSIDALQEQISRSLLEVRSLSASWPGKLPGEDEQRIAEQCTETSKQIAEECMNLVRQLPELTDKVSEEVATKVKLLANQIGSKEQYVDSVSESQATSANDTKDVLKEVEESSKGSVAPPVSHGPVCGGGCGSTSGKAAQSAEGESAEEIVRNLRMVCEALAKETKIKCGAMSEYISKVVSKI